jgi:adenylate cyclase
MSEQPQRRLAAILAADVAGYSRLMGEDETGTLTALRRFRAHLLEPAVAHHHGQIVKSMGDGWLIAFDSAADAVACAIGTQEGLSGHDVLRIRIGLHIGDVTYADGDIFGDGVNIASRLQETAEPGSVVISDVVHRSIDGKLAAVFNELGSLDLKNIAKPVAAYGWGIAEVVEKPAELSLSDKPSIAVLPFDNMSTNSEHEFFADGISEDIITTLSKINRIKVIARNSTFAYKGRANDLRRVAEELGVRYILEGSVRSGGSRLRITAQLIDATDGSQVWADRYDRAAEDLFDIQDEITKEVVTALQVLQNRFNATDYLEARALAERAVARDPGYAYAIATLGFTWWWDGRLGYTGDSHAKFERAAEYARRAMEIDDSVSFAIGLTVMAAAPLGGEREALEIARRGFADQPGNADIRAFLAYALLHCGEYEEALEHLQAAMQLNPFAPIWYRNGLTRALYLTGRSKEAGVVIDDNLATDNSNIQAWLMRGLVLRDLGRRDEARAGVSEARRLAPDLRVSHIPQLMLIHHSDEKSIDMLKSGLADLGLPE